VKTYLIKKISEVKEKNLFEFYSKVFNTKKNSFILNYKWHYRLGYNEFEPIVIIVDDLIIGHAGLIPAEVLSQGRKFPAIWFIDFVVLPEYQSKGFGKILTEEWMKICPNQITYCNNLSLRVFKKLKWQDNSFVKRKIYPINFFNIFPSLKKIELNFANKFFRFFLKKKLSNNKAIKFYNISDQIIKNCTLAEKKFDTSSPAIIRDESWFQWRLGECPYKTDLLYFENNDEFIIGHIFFQNRVKRLNIIYSNTKNNSEIFSLLINWSLENQIDYLWYVNSKFNINSHLPSFFNKTINFAYNTNDQELLKDLSRGLSNTSGIDSDIDYISRDN